MTKSDAMGNPGWLEALVAGAAAVGVAMGLCLLAVALTLWFALWFVWIPLLTVGTWLGLVAVGTWKGARGLQEVLSARAAAPAPPVRSVQRVKGAMAASAPHTIRVVGVRGICPLGLQVSNTFTVSLAGQITPTICRPALEAVRPLLLPVLEEERAASVACACPLQDHPQVCFSVFSAEPVGA